MRVFYFLIWGSEDHLKEDTNIYKPGRSWQIYLMIVNTFVQAKIT